MIFLILSAILLSMATPLSLGLDNIAIGFGLVGLILIAKKIKFDKLDKIFLSFQGLGILSAALSIGFFESLKKSRFLWHYLPYYIASRLDRNKITLLVNILGVSAFVASLGVVFHAFTGMRPTHIPWSDLSSVHFLRHPIRPDGFFHNPFTSVGILSILFFLFLGLSVFVKNFKSRIYYGFLSISIFPSIVLTMCRSYWIGVGMAIIVMPFLYRKYLAPKIISASMVVLFVLMYSFVPLVHNRVQTIIHYKKNTSAEVRLMLWKSALQLYDDYGIKNKLIGCGNNHVFYFVKSYEERNSLDKFGYLSSSVTYHYSMHNLYLQLLLQWGIIGLAIWIYLWIYVVYRNIVFINKTDNEFNRAFVIGVTAGFIAFLIGGFFEYNIGDSEIAIFFTYMLGLNKNILDSLKGEVV